MRRIAFLALCVATLLGVAATMAGAARAQDRIALVIGNERYTNLPAEQQLAKAVNDARAVGNALEKIGFTVIRGENLDRQGMVDRIFEFTRKIKPGDMALLFYAGHGVAISGGNYLLPSDVRIAGPGEESRVRNMAIGEADIIADIQDRRARVAVLMLDACRDNPFRQPGMTRSAGGERGLSRGQEAAGVFAVYSAGFGQSALDNLGPNDKSANSVFTRVLVPALARKDAHLADLIIDVREQVAKLATSVGHVQSPAYYDQTTGGRVYLASPAAAAPAALFPPAIVQQAITPSPAAIDRLGKVWNEEEGDGWKGLWTRRGTSTTYDAAWMHASGGRVSATLDIALDGNKIAITRNDSSSYPCAYQGTLAADGVTAGGTYGCYMTSTDKWNAVIEGVASGDRLGRRWQEEEGGWKAVWTRRGNSSTFDANWTHPTGGKISASLVIARVGDKIAVTRLDTSNQHCTYQGVIGPDGKTVAGTYRCYATNTSPTWRATIGK